MRHHPLLPSNVAQRRGEPRQMTLGRHDYHQLGVHGIGGGTQAAELGETRAILLNLV
jgi:hypothetical protein